MTKRIEGITSTIMTTNIEIPMDKIVALCQRHQIRELSLFGSVLRDDFRPTSDVDVLIDLCQVWTSN
jgi:predicted nucleotidyltransferase